MTDGVLVSKYDRGKQNDPRKICDVATKAIDPKFGFSKHFISPALGVCKEVDKTEETFIQNLHTQNLAKVAILDMRLIMYYMKGIFVISTLISDITTWQIHGMMMALVCCFTGRKLVGR